MNLPSGVNLTIRALVLPPCPSLTMMSPLAATATSVGALNSSGPSPATPGLPSVSSTLPCGLNLMTCMALAVAAGIVGRPHVAAAIDIEAVGVIEEPLAEAGDELSGRIEFLDRVERGVDAVLHAAAVEHPDALAVGIDVDARHLPDLAAFRNLEPILVETVGIGGAIGIGRRLRERRRPQRRRDPQGQNDRACAEHECLLPGGRVVLAAHCPQCLTSTPPIDFERGCAFTVHPLARPVQSNPRRRI